MPKVMRLALLPFAALLELVLLALGGVLAVCMPRYAERLVELSKRLPAIGWYVER